LKKVKIIGESPAVNELLDMIGRVSSSRSNVLIIGESGTGKELVARMIHESGPWAQKPFVTVNCGAIPENLIESELFGHKKGSFTGAIAEKPGLFEVAHTGTLFLDEVGELPLPMQVKLLRALQERTIRKVGGNDDIKIDVRVIAATNRDLEIAASKGTFREDLYYRLNVIQIRTPSLRERRSDIRILATHFLARYAEKHKKDLLGMEPETIAALEAYGWPGNVRELENTIERACILENKSKVGVATLPPAVTSANGRTLQTPTAQSVAAAAAEHRASAGASSAGPDSGEIRIPAPDFTKGPMALETVLGDIEKIYLKAALDHAGGIKKNAAELLGITFRSMRYRLKKLGLESGDAAGEDEQD
jgi:two-component system response regulator PilR (NtrC family)